MVIIGCSVTYKLNWYISSCVNYGWGCKNPFDISTEIYVCIFALCCLVHEQVAAETLTAMDDELCVVNASERKKEITIIIIAHLAFAA